MSIRHENQPLLSQSSRHSPRLRLASSPPRTPRLHQPRTAGNGLLLEYKFEEDVVDSSGNQRNGKVQGNPTFAAGRVGKCIVFDGEGDYIYCGPVPAELGQTFTVECWVKPEPRGRTSMLKSSVITRKEGSALSCSNTVNVNRFVPQIMERVQADGSRRGRYSSLRASGSTWRW